MKSSRLLAGICVAALAAAFSACSNGAAPGEGGAGDFPASITLWSRGANETINRALVDAWNADHEMKVELLPIPDDEYDQKLAAAVSAGNPPDVVTLDVVKMPELMAGGVLADLTDEAKALPYFDALAQSYVDYSTLDGKIYALPENIDASSLFWNKDLFQKAGLDPEQPPTSFTEIRDYAAKISALDQETYGFYLSGQCGGCNRYTMSPLIWASGGDYTDETGTKATLTSPGVVETMKLYQDLWNNGDIAPGAKDDTGANWVSSFGNGNIGMIGLGAFAIAQLRDFPDVNYGIAPLPGLDGEKSSFTGGDVIAIPAGAKHFGASWEFLEWTLTEAAQVEVYAKSGSLVARSDLVNNEHFTDPNMVAENEVAMIGRLPVYYKNANEIDAVTGPYNRAFQAIVFGGADVTTELEKANEEFQRLLDQA